MQKRGEHFTTQAVIIKVWVHINSCVVLWKVWRMDGLPTHFGILRRSQ